MENCLEDHKILRPLNVRPLYLVVKGFRRVVSGLVKNRGEPRRERHWAGARRPGAPVRQNDTLRKESAVQRASPRIRFD